jgi:hypothetical protein
MTQNLTQLLAFRPTPVQDARLRSEACPEGQIEVVVQQIAEQGGGTAQLSELGEEQVQALLDFFVGIELQFVVGSHDKAGGRLAEPFAALDPIQSARLHALLELMQFETSHESFEPENHPIVKILGMVNAIEIGHEGVERGTGLDQPEAGFILACQAIDLEAEDDADVAQGNFAEQPGEVIASDGRGAGASLIALENTNAFGGPAPLAGLESEIGLHLGRFFVAKDLLPRGLPNIDDGPAFPVAGLNFRRGQPDAGIKGIHAAPPFRRAGFLRGEAGASA